MKSALLLLTVLMSLSSFGAQTAKVLMVRGEVTALRPGDVDAIKVKKGQVLPEDTSILTAAKSIVRLKFADKSTMNLGPKSKVVVTKMPEKKPNMINLLTGAIKAEVNKNSNKQSSNKMLIKTRSAVMGVRGTKFQAGFNPANGNTSLVTVEGKVAMVKKKAIEKKVVKEVVKEKVVDESGKEVIKEVVKEKAISVAQAVDPEQELEMLDKALETSKEAVEVPAGRFSGVSEAAKESTPTAPTKIAPQQYNALAKSMDSEKKAEDVFTDEELEQAAKSSADTAGAVGQKAGGFVDFNTGIYVPPPKGSKKDNKTGVYIAKDVGKVDEKTGDYIPPKGIKLDAKKGFVVNKEEVAKLASSDKKALEKTLKKLETVNEEVKDQVVVNRITAKEKKNSKPWYKADYHHFKASIQPYSETITADNKLSSTEAEFYTQQANITEFSWTQQWSDRISTELGFGFIMYKLDDSQVDVEERDTDGNDEKFWIGLNYNWSDSLRFTVRFVDQAFYFPRPEGIQNTVALDAQTLNYIDLEGRYFLYDWRQFSVYAGGNLFLFGETEVPGDSMSGPKKIDSSGLKGYMTLKFEFRDDMGILGTGFVERYTHEVESEMEWTRIGLGTQAQFYYIL